MESVGPARVVVVLLEVAVAGGDFEAAPVVTQGEGAVTLCYGSSVVFVVSVNVLNEFKNKLILNVQQMSEHNLWWSLR